MKLHRLATASAAALAFVLISAVPAQAQFGIGAGLNFNDLDDVDTSSGSATFDESTGYHFGLFFNIGSGPVSVRPGVFYHQIGTYDFPDGDELKMSAVEVPIDIRLDFAPGSPVSVYLLAGPVISFPSAGDGEFGEAFEDMSLSADIDAGLALGLPGGGFTVMPELRYSRGLSDFWSDDFSVGSVTVSPAVRRISKWMIRLNVMF
jgi:hypothetical protein